MRKNSKTIPFSFSMPIPLIKKDAGRAVISQAGELLVCAKARIAAALGDLPLAFADQKENEIRIVVESIHFNGVNILPVFNLPDAKGLMASIQEAAINNLKNIQNL